jgi:hypothetical protein
MKLYRVLSKLPYFIQIIPYAIAKYVVINLLTTSKTKVWVRNSYVFNNLVCALSDLDFTIITSDINDADKAVKKFRLLKKIFPFLGEINLYNKNELNEFSPIANSYEIARDPELQSILGLKETNYSKYQKIVFLCKTLESDQENLKSIPHLRVKKWTHHLNKLNENSEITLDSLKELLSKLALELKIDGNKFLDQYYKLNRTEKVNCDNFYRENEDKKSYILLYPFRWIGSSLTCDSFFHDIEEIKNFSNEQLLLLEAQIEWEIWGLYSQYIHNLRQATLHTHLENIKQMMDTSVYLKETKSYALLNKLRSLHENLLLHYPRNDRP